MLELARYVVLNPLRAGMINEIDDWPWNSYPSMIGATPTPVWLQTDWLLGQFDPQEKHGVSSNIPTLSIFKARKARVE